MSQAEMNEDGKINVLLSNQYDVNELVESKIFYLLGVWIIKVGS